jgi:hypothetical protein
MIVNAMTQDPKNSFEELKTLAPRLAEASCDADTYERAAKALVGCLTPGEGEAAAGYRGWSGDEKSALLERLLLQEHCDARPSFLLRPICAYASSHGTAPMEAAAKELAPALRTLLRREPPAPHVVLAVITLREFLGDGWSQREISALHIRNFHRFEREDLSIPYSTTFLSHVYWRNVEDLLGPDGDGKPVSADPKLELFHLLLIDWLATRRPPFAADNASLLLTVDAGRGHAGPEGRRRDALAAGKSLLARHLSQPTASEASAMDRWFAEAEPGNGFVKGVSFLAEARVRVDRSLSGKRVAGRRRRMEGKAYQAAQVLKNKAMARFGRALSIRRRPRVAVCVSGQLRGYRYAVETWKKHFFPGVDCDTYVHCWENIGHSEAQPTRAQLPFEGEEFVKAYRKQCMELGFEVVKGRYPRLFGALSTGAIADLAELRSLYGTEFVVIENDRAPRFSGWSNSRKMHYKIHACSELALGQGKDYDLVLRIRPDKPMRYFGFGWPDVIRRCRSEPLIFSETAMGLHYGHPAMGDQVALGAPEAMRVYASTYEIYPGLTPHGLFNFPAELAGHTSLAYVCWLHGIRVEKLPVKWEWLREPKALSMATILETVGQDAAGRNDVWDQAVLGAIRDDVGGA